MVELSKVCCETSAHASDCPNNPNTLGFDEPGLWMVDDWVDEGVVGAMRKPSVSDLVEALDGKRIEHYCVMHQGRVWAYPDLSECTFQRYQRANLGQPAETPCDIQPVAVVPLGEDT